MQRFWLTMAVGIACLIASGVVASMAKAQATGDPAAVITAYEMARNRGDLDAALAYFSDNAVISQRNTTFSGKDEIRRFLTGLSARSRFIVVTDRVSSGNQVTWTERTGSTQTTNTVPPARAPQGFTGVQTGGVNGGQGVGGGGGVGGVGGNQTGGAGLGAQRFPGAVVTSTTFAVSVSAVVQDGKIQSMAYTFGNQAAPIDPSLQGRAQLPASVGLVAVLAVLVGVLMIASTGVGRRGAVASSLQGRLMQDLQGWAAARE